MPIIADTPIDRDYDALLARLDPPMIIVTAGDGARRAGCLVGFHSQCSIEPRRHAVWLSKANQTYEVAQDAEMLGLHVLDPGQRALAERFGSITGDEEDKFAGIDWTWRDGVPVLEQCPNRVIGRKTTMVETGGDHVCVVVEPVIVELGADVAQLGFQAVKEVEPGHAATDRRRTDWSAPAEDASVEESSEDEPGSDAQA